MSSNATTLPIAVAAATISMTTADDTPPIWKKRVAYTDFPAGDWMFFLTVDGLLDPERLVTVLLLPSEN